MVGQNSEMKKTLLIGFISLIISVCIIDSNENLGVLLFLFSIALIFISLFVLLITFFKAKKEEKEEKEQRGQKLQKEIRPHFVKASSFRKKDGIIKAGECLLDFNEDNFLIKQDNQIIENKISSIYLLDIWEYKDDTYFKIVMRSHTEYMFISMNFEADSVLEILSKLDVIIEDNRKEE